MRMAFHPIPPHFHQPSLEVSALLDRDDPQQLLSNTKTVLSELNDELAGCMWLNRLFGYSADVSHLGQRVNDLLRDKLHHTMAQLADATSRTRELEEDKRDLWNRNLQQSSQNEVLQQSLISSGK